MASESSQGGERSGGNNEHSALTGITEALFILELNTAMGVMTDVTRICLRLRK
jgi:hypothetical protein